MSLKKRYAARQRRLADIHAAPVGTGNTGEGLTITPVRRHHGYGQFYPPFGGLVPICSNR